MEVLRRAGSMTAVALPGALVVVFGFNAGGFFPAVPALVAVELAAVIAVRAAVAERPFAGFSRLSGVAASALALFAAWQLVSSSWSHAPGRATVEFDRTALYLLTLVLFASLPRRRRHLRRLMRSVTVGGLAVCGAGLLSRLLPHLWPTAPSFANNRLSYPVTYWNALGLLAALMLLLCVHMTSDLREPRLVRILGAAGVPVFATTLLLTFSRGAIGALIIAAVVYVALARPIGLLSAVLSALPAGAVSVVAAYRAKDLATLHPTTAAAVGQGQRLAVVVAACVLGAAVVRAILTRLDARLATLTAQGQRWHRATTPALALAAVGAVVLLAAVHAPARIHAYYEGFVHNDKVRTTTDVRQRLTDPSSSHRVEHWRVAVHAFDARELQGWGAGTYETLWEAHRPILFDVTDAHSLYAEDLAELGLVGLVLLVTCLGAILVASGRRARGEDRALYAALFATSVMWGVHAGVDWDWEMPVVTIPLFALGGAALASSARRRRPPALHSRPARAGIAVAALATAVIPLLVATSQRPLDAALAAFERHDCSTATTEARRATSDLGFRPEPYELLAYCEARAGHGAVAIAAMRHAMEHDPRFWEYRYGLAIVKASGGFDPRPDAAAALRLNPLQPLPREALRRFAGGDPASWPRQAADAGISVGPDGYTLRFGDLVAPSTRRAK